MTEQEAINVFKGFKFTPREMKAVAMGVEALEKQIPKKPIIKTNAYNHKFYECPNCGIDIEHVIFSPYLYCHKCAQKIEKAEVEE